MVTTTIKVQFRTRKKAAKPETAALARTKPRLPGVVADRLARRLALAHCVERLIEAGQIADYAHAARVLGVSRARITQVMDLLLVPSDVQEQVLLGQWSGGERALRMQGERSLRKDNASIDTPGRAVPMSGASLSETPKGKE